MRNPSEASLPSSVANRVDLLGDCRGALELQVQIERLLRVELLAAFWALERSGHLDAHVGNGAVTRLRGRRDLHGLGHPARKGVLETQGLARKVERARPCTLR